MYYQQPQTAYGASATYPQASQFAAQPAASTYAQPAAATGYGQPAAYGQAAATPSYAAPTSFAQPAAAQAPAYPSYYASSAQPAASSSILPNNPSFSSPAAARLPAAPAAPAYPTIDVQRQQLQQQQQQLQQQQLAAQQKLQQQQQQQQYQLQQIQQQQLQAAALKQQQIQQAQMQQQLAQKQLQQQQLEQQKRAALYPASATPRGSVPARMGANIAPPLSYDSGLPSSLRGPSSSSRDPKRDLPRGNDRDRDRDRRPLYSASASSSRRRVERRRSSPPPKRESSVLPTGDLAEPTRKYKQLKARYPNMYVPTDFSYIENSWLNTVKAVGVTPRPLFVTHEAIDFEVSNVKVEEPAPAKTEESKDATKSETPTKEGAKEGAKDGKDSAKETVKEATKEPAKEPAKEPVKEPAPVVESFSASGKRYNVRVALINGVPPEDLINVSLPHLCRQLKFIVQEKKESESSKYLSLIGGLWTKEDGGDPDTELESLIRTAIRTTKEFLGINLEHVLKWSVLGKVYFTRPQEERHGKVTPKREDVSVLLLPHLSHWDPAGMTVEQPNENQQQENETEESATTEAAAGTTDETEKKDDKKEVVPGVVHREGEGILVRVVTKSAKLKARFLSLDGLLDYRTSDSMERTFEVSLCAELVKEMLQRDFGETLYNNLLQLPEKKKEEKKEKPAASSSGDKDKRERDREEEDGAKKDEEKKDEEKKEEKKETFQVLVNPVLFSAYRFFDRGDKGHVLGHDVEDILHSLGHKLTQKQVRYLTDKVSHSQTGRIYYKDYTHIEAKEGDPRPTPEFMYSSDAGEDVVDETPLDTLQQGNGSYIDATNLMARLEKSESARRHAIVEANRATDELQRFKSLMEDGERKYEELSNAAHTNNAFLGSKIREAEKFKSLVMVIKAALKKAEEDFNAPPKFIPKVPQDDVEMTSSEATPQKEEPAPASESSPAKEPAPVSSSPAKEVKEEEEAKEEAKEEKDGKKEEAEDETPKKRRRTAKKKTT